MKHIKNVSASTPAKAGILDLFKQILSATGPLAALLAAQPDNRSADLDVGDFGRPLPPF